MDPAALLMLSTFGVAVLLGVFVEQSWIAVPAPLFIPVLTVASGLKGPRIGEALLFVSPFLVVAVIHYGAISFTGVMLGRWLRSRAAGGRARVGATERDDGAH